MIDWESIISVFLDMDGTLLDLNFDNYFWLEYVPMRFAKQNNLTLNAAKEILFPRFKSMEGRLQWYCLDYWSKELKLDVAELKRDVAESISVLPHVVDFLEALKLTGKRLILVTNAHPKSLRLKLEKTGLQRFFDRIICAHDLGLAKEQAGFWENVNAVEPFEKDRTLLVDDSLPVLRCARNFGIRHLMAIAKPDSNQSVREITDYSAIKDLSQLLPVCSRG